MHVLALLGILPFDVYVSSFSGTSFFLQVENENNETTITLSIDDDNSFIKRSKMI